MTGWISSIALLPVGTYWTREEHWTPEEKRLVFAGQMSADRIAAINQRLQCERDRLWAMPVAGVDEFPPPKLRVN